MFKHMLVVLLGLAMVTVGCGTGGGGGGGGGGGSHGVDTTALSGSWFGPFSGGSSYYGTLSATVDTTGHFNFSETANHTSGSGSITPLHAQVYGTNIGGTVGGFMVDAAFAHTVFMDEDWSFGAIQKGATSLPSYSTTNLVGNWAGLGVHLYGDGTIERVFTISATVQPNLSFSGSDFSGTFSGSFYNTLSGGWTAASGTQGGQPFLMTAFMTPDKQFLGYYAGPSVGYFPEDYTIGFVNKQ